MLTKINYIFLIGMLAQLFFGLRVLIQWVATEKNNKVTSPALYWILSLTASVLFMAYGWLRKDWVIIAGQSFSYYVYIINLKITKSWYVIPTLLRHGLQVFPLIIWLLAPLIFPNINIDFYLRVEIPLWLILLGFAGQLFMNARFIVQLVYASKHRLSVFPLNFWIMSLAGSTLLIIYGAFRSDAVLIISQFFSLIPYSRNMFFALKEKR